jgi:hypothetical protein
VDDFSVAARCGEKVRLIACPTVALAGARVLASVSRVRLTTRVAPTSAATPIQGWNRKQIPT